MKKIISLCLILMMSCGLCSCKEQNSEIKIEQIRMLCELSTVKAYYNNVAKSKKEDGKKWYNVLEKEREFWIEYDGVADIGVDVKKVKIEINDETVYITMPKAELLNIRIVKETFDKSSYVTNKDSWWDKNKITTEDQQGAINKAQDEMKKTVKKDVVLFERAERIAKETIKNYIEKIGEISGTKFNVVWK